MNYSAFFYVESRRKELRAQVETARAELTPIYDYYVEIPPDWKERRSKVIARDRGECHDCGRLMSQSRMHFHIHHIIAKANKDGNHKLENLRLLCEECHAEQLAPGHQLIEEKRRSRFKRTGKY